MKQQFFLARDKDGSLWLYEGRPIKRSYYFERGDEDADYIEISDERIYPEVTWENSPIELTLQLPPELCTLH